MRTGARDYARVAGWFYQALDAPECPLTAEEREQAKRNFTFHLAKRTLQDLRRGRWQFSRQRLHDSTLTVRDWLTYLRPPRRNLLAGTPLDADGRCVMPRWLAH